MNILLKQLWHFNFFPPAQGKKVMKIFKTIGWICCLSAVKPKTSVIDNSFGF